MKKRFWSLILTVVMVAACCVSLCACGSGDGSSKEGELTIWVGDGLEDMFTEMAKDYTKETGIKVHVFTYTGLTAADKLALDGPFGKGGDIYVQGGGGDLAGAVEQGLFVKLDKNEFELETKFIGGAQTLMQYQGELYGVPLGIETTALMYNKDIIPELPDTWEEICAFARSYNHFGSDIRTKDQKFGLLIDYTNPYYTWCFNEAFGGYIFGQDENGAYDCTDIGIDNEGSIKACAFIKDMIDTKTIPTDLAATLMQSKFISGKAAIILDGSWDLSNFREAGINLGVAAFPEISLGDGTFGQPVTFCGGYGLAISSFSLNIEESKNFLKFATRDKYVLAYYNTVGRIPATVSASQTPEVQNDEALKGFMDQLAYSYPQPAINELNAIWDPLVASTTAIYVNGEDIAEVMHKVKADIEANIELLHQ